jgi:xylulokinase
MLPKLLWLRTHQPNVWGRAKRLCLISDYLTLLFTGKHMTEAGAAGLTGVVDIQRCEWMKEAVAFFEIPRNWLAEIVRAGTDLGPISGDAVQRWGLPTSCRFIVGCLDQYAGAIGAGNTEPGRVSETTGTVLATVRCADQFNVNVPPTVFQGPGFASGQYFQMTFGDTSAAWLEWFRNREMGHPSFEELIASAANVPPGADGLRLRPGAEVTAETDVFAGLTARHTRGQKVRCILEAVAAALCEQVRAVCGDRLPAEIRSVGGAARSELWRQIKADMLGVKVTAVDCPEPTCLGAALLAEASLSGRDIRQIAQSWVQLGPPLLSNPDRHRRYQELGL